MSFIEEPHFTMRDIFPIKKVQNFPFSGMSPEENILEAINFTARDGDLLICTYPLVSSSWIINCIFKLFRQTADNYDFNYLHNRLVPCLEIVGIKMLYDGEEPRIIRTSLPFSLMKINPNAKYIYITRNPKDIMVSYFLIAARYGYRKVLWNNFFLEFMNGNLPYGNYFEHIRSWYSNKRDNILFLNYETMHVNPKDNILAIAKFLGPKHYEVCLNNTAIKNILYFPDFDYKHLTVEGEGMVMCLSKLADQHNELKRYIDAYVHMGYVHAHDTGYVSIWKTFFTAEQNQLMNNLMVQEFQSEIYKIKGINMFDFMRYI